MCYGYPTELVILLAMSVILNFFLGFAYAKLMGKYAEASQLAESMVKLLKKAGKIK